MVRDRRASLCCRPGVEAGVTPYTSTATFLVEDDAVGGDEGVGDVNVA